jgi:hypothetical protein
MTVSVYDQPGGAQTIQFSDRTANHIVEVLASPYTQLDLTLSHVGTPTAHTTNPTTSRS